MKVHKVELFVIDFDNVGADEIHRLIESARYPNRCIMPNVTCVYTAETGPWDDDHPLNHRATMAQEMERLFPNK